MEKPNNREVKKHYCFENELYDIAKNKDCSDYDYCSIFKIAEDRYVIYNVKEHITGRLHSKIVIRSKEHIYYIGETPRNHKELYTILNLTCITDVSFSNTITDNIDDVVEEPIGRRAYKSDFYGDDSKFNIYEYFDGTYDYCSKHQRAIVGWLYMYFKGGAYFGGYNDMVVNDGAVEYYRGLAPSSKEEFDILLSLLEDNQALEVCEWNYLDKETKICIERLNKDILAKE